MTDHQAKSATMSFRVMTIEAAIANDINATILATGGWKVDRIEPLPDQEKIVVYFKKKDSRGICSSFITVKVVP